MKTTLALSSIVFAALSVAAVGAHADDADPSGQFAASAAAHATRADVQAQYQQYRSAGVNPWSTSYNPLKSFQGQRTRDEVRNDFLASRNAVAAMTAEDSGSGYLAAHRRTVETNRQLAGQPGTGAD